MLSPKSPSQFQYSKHSICQISCRRNQITKGENEHNFNVSSTFPLKYNKEATKRGIMSDLTNNIVFQLHIRTLQHGASSLH